MQLQGPLFTLYGTQFPKSIVRHAGGLLMLVSVWLLLTRTRIGLRFRPRPGKWVGAWPQCPVCSLVFGSGAALAG